jgi:hypothetical protein
MSTLFCKINSTFLSKAQKNVELILQKEGRVSLIPSIDLTIFVVILKRSYSLRIRVKHVSRPHLSLAVDLSVAYPVLDFCSNFRIFELHTLTMYLHSKRVLCELVLWRNLR